MSSWLRVKILICFLLAGCTQAQGQSCTMSDQPDMKISDVFLSSVQVLTGATDTTSCSDACLGTNDCAVAELRGSVCIYVTDDTALVGNAGSTSFLKTCTAGSGTTVPTDMTTENAHATRPLLVLMVTTTVLATLLGRRL